MDSQQAKLIAVIVILLLPTVLLYVRSFVMSFVYSWFHRKDLNITTIGDLMSNIDDEMDNDILISSEFPFIIPFFSIFTLCVITVLDLGHLICYLFDKTIYRLLKKSVCKFIYKFIWQYIVKIPIRYCIMIPYSKLCSKFESIKERIYNINI